MATRLERPVRSRRNLYAGVNAHLHSLWQAEGGWNNFHNVHIGDMAKLLRAQLLDMGYTVTVEDSMQVRVLPHETYSPQSDLLIRDPDQVRATLPVYGRRSGAQATLSIDEVVEFNDEEHPYRALAISKPSQGHAVAWIELISPTNKVGTHGAEYRVKRERLLASGIVFVEIDYLHTLPPTFSGSHVHDYSKPKQRDHAHPYRIVVLDPHPDMRHGPATLAEFDVDMPIPELSIPLSAGDAVIFDFGAAYRKTYEEMLYGLESVDYRFLPENFESYSPADQTRITRRMLAVLRAASAGIMLDSLTEPLPVEDIPLEEALEQLQAFA